MNKWAYRTRDNMPDEEEVMPLFSDEDPQVDMNFTERVMEQVRQTEIQPASGGTMRVFYGNLGRRRIRKVALWGSSAAAIIVLGAWLLLSPNISVLQQTRAAAPQRMLIIPSEWKEHHLLEAKKAGVVQLPGIEVTDHGYTLTLQEVVADPNRMILNLRITDSKGQPDEEKMSMFDVSQLQLRNEAGKVIGALQSINRMETPVPGDKYRQEYLLLTYHFNETLPGDTVFVEGNVHELMKDPKNNEKLKGDWSFSYAADMTKAQALTVTTSMDNYTYSAPEGLKITMDKITHSPAGVKIEFNTTLTDELVSRMPEHGKVGDLGIMFHLEDAQGRVLGEPFNSKYSGNYALNWDGQDRQIHWTYHFDDLPYLNEPVTFVLDSFSLPVKSNDSLTFIPATLKSEPSVFKAQGDVLNVNSMKITETQRQPGLSAWLAISGEFSNKFDKDIWIARDDNGKTYDVIRNGSFSDGDPVTFGQLDERTNLVFLIVKGMTAVPSELTLVRTVTDKSFKNVDWRFVLPGAEVLSR